MKLKPTTPDLNSVQSCSDPLFDVGMGKQEHSSNSTSNSRFTIDIHGPADLVSTRTQKGTDVTSSKIQKNTALDQSKIQKDTYKMVPKLKGIMVDDEDVVDSQQVLSLQNTTDLFDIDNNDFVRHDSITYHPENVVFKSKGLVCVKPSNDFLYSADMHWKNCCLGHIVENKAVSFVKLKDMMLKKFEPVGLTIFLKHFLGYYVLQFYDKHCLSRALKYNPVHVKNCVMFLQPWKEHFHVVFPLEHEKVWVKLSNIPFLLLVC